MASKTIEETSQLKHKWLKLGRVYKPRGVHAWSVSHAANPTAEHIKDDLFRIYFSTRDKNNRSSISYVVIDLKNPTEVLEEASEPVLAPGELSMFDDSGVSIGCILPVDDKRYLYYMGWNLSVTVPWKNALGLAISEGPGQPFKRYSRFPVVPLSEVDPYTISYPWVAIEDGRFRMWYGSNLKWGAVKEDMLHVIKYAESSDGINWECTDKVIIDCDYPVEYAMCRPTVMKDGNDYLMWFCSRGHRYRIELAKSPDGNNWTRLGRDTGIDVDLSTGGWDSDMIEYPCVFEHKGNRYLLYCGAEYAKTGFGIAVLEKD